MTKIGLCLAINIVFVFTAICGGAGAKTKTKSSGAIRYSQIYKATISGHRIRILDELALNPDCSSLGDIALKVVQAPSHGQDIQSDEDMFPFFQPPDPRVKCNEQKFTAVAMFYTPVIDFIGHDMTEVQVAYPTGVIYDIKIDIDVK